MTNESGLWTIGVWAFCIVGLSELAVPLPAVAQPPSPTTTAHLRILADVEYQTAEPSERADVYLPTRIATASPLPAVIWMHGSDHDKADSRERNVCSQLAEAGYIAISINYGGWPASDVGEEHSPRILQNIANARSAVLFFRAHAADYAIDPAHIALFGGSAGAWLALMVGFADARAPFSSTAYPGVSSAVAAIGDFYADLDPWLKASITAKSPPVLIVHGKADPAVSYRDSVELSRRLTKLGVPHRLILLDHVGHSFDFTSWRNKPLPRDLRPSVLAFLEKYLGPPGSRPPNKDECAAFPGVRPNGDICTPVPAHSGAAAR